MDTEPDDLATWSRLRQDLVRLEAENGDALVVYPSLHLGYPRRPPAQIDLSPSALDVAADLHQAYGDFVQLTVGALPYPPEDGRPRWDRLKAREKRKPIDPRKLVVELESPLSVATGETVTHAVLVTNRSRRKVAIHTNGFLTADIVDADGTVVGGFVGPQTAPMVVYSAPPHGAVRIELLVGTASHTSELGYAIPPGTWHLTVPLDLAKGRRLVSPPLEFTVV